MLSVMKIRNRAVLFTSALASALLLIGCTSPNGSISDSTVDSDNSGLEAQTSVTANELVGLFESAGGDCSELLENSESSLFGGLPTTMCLPADGSVVTFVSFFDETEMEFAISSAVMDDPGLCLGETFAVHFTEESLLDDFADALSCSGPGGESANNSGNDASGKTEGGFTLWSDFELGKCYDSFEFLPDRKAKAVECSEPHEVEVFFATEFDGANVKALGDFAWEKCQGAFSDYVGVSEVDSVFAFALYYPNEDEFAAGVRAVSCAIKMPDDSPTSGSAKGSSR
jgi:hypothetical protein